MTIQIIIHYHFCIFHSRSNYSISSDNENSSSLKRRTLPKCLISKGSQNEAAKCPGNVANWQTFPSAGFVRLFHWYICNRSTLLLQMWTGEPRMATVTLTQLLSSETISRLGFHLRHKSEATACTGLLCSTQGPGWARLVGKNHCTRITSSEQFKCFCSQSFCGSHRAHGWLGDDGIMDSAHRKAYSNVSIQRLLIKESVFFFFIIMTSCYDHCNKSTGAACTLVSHFHCPFNVTL